ncbi:MAG: ArsC/Spx/MgsR family protein [Gammaproteobacteria bacterium]
MAEIEFFEKPGCINNSRQKKLLVSAGHKVIAKNLLEQDWEPDELAKYFSGMPVSAWFNQSAPSVKNGDITPGNLTEAQAIKAMIKDPILIRRPLIRINSRYKSGFEYREIHEWIGLDGIDVEEDLESCPRVDIEE